LFAVVAKTRRNSPNPTHNKIIVRNVSGVRSKKIKSISARKRYSSRKPSQISMR